MPLQYQRGQHARDACCVQGQARAGWWDEDLPNGERKRGEDGEHGLMDGGSQERQLRQLPQVRRIQLILRAKKPYHTRAFPGTMSFYDRAGGKRRAWKMSFEKATIVGAPTTALMMPYRIYMHQKRLFPSIPPYYPSILPQKTRLRSPARYRHYA